MNLFIVYFLPSILGLKIFRNLNKEKKYFDLIINYFMFVLFSNLLCTIIFFVMDKKIINLSDTLASSYGFSYGYMLVAMALNIILSILSTIVGKYFEVSIEVENGKKEKSKKSKKNN